MRPTWPRRGKIGNWKAYTLVGTNRFEDVNYNSTWSEGLQNLKSRLVGQKKILLYSKTQYNFAAL